MALTPLFPYHNIFPPPHVSHVGANFVLCWMEDTENGITRETVINLDSLEACCLCAAEVGLGGQPSVHVISHPPYTRIIPLLGII